MSVPARSANGSITATSLGTLYEPSSSNSQAQVGEDEIIDDRSLDLIWSGHQWRVLLAKGIQSVGQ